MHKEITKERLDNLEKLVIETFERKFRGEDTVGLNSSMLSVIMQCVRSWREQLEETQESYPMFNVDNEDRSFSSLELPYQ